MGFTLRYLFYREISLLKHSYADFHGRVVAWINLLLLLKTRAISKCLLKNLIWHTAHTEVAAVVSPAVAGSFVSQKRSTGQCNCSSCCCVHYVQQLPETQLLEKSKKKLQKHLKLCARLQHGSRGSNIFTWQCNTASSWKLFNIDNAQISRWESSF